MHFGLRALAGNFCQALLQQLGAVQFGVEPVAGPARIDRDDDRFGKGLAQLIALAGQLES
jgi:hypothetical protein